MNVQAANYLSGLWQTQMEGHSKKDLGCALQMHQAFSNGASDPGHSQTIQWSRLWLPDQVLDQEEGRRAGQEMTPQC